MASCATRTSDVACRVALARSARTLLSSASRSRFAALRWPPSKIGTATATEARQLQAGENRPVGAWTSGSNSALIEGR